MRRRISAPRKGEFSAVKFQLRWAFPQRHTVYNVRTFIKISVRFASNHIDQFCENIPVLLSRSNGNLNFSRNAQLLYLFTSVNNLKRIFRAFLIRWRSHVVKISRWISSDRSVQFLRGSCKTVHGNTFDATPVNSSRVFSEKKRKKKQNDRGVRRENDTPVDTLLVMMALGITIAVVHCWLWCDTDTRYLCMRD